MYGPTVGGISVATGGAAATLAFTGVSSMMLVLVAVALIVSGLLCLRMAALRTPRR